MNIDNDFIMDNFDDRVDYTPQSNQHQKEQSFIDDSFGITDTKELAKSELDSFLFSDVATTPTGIVKPTEKEVEEKQEPEKPKSTNKKPVDKKEELDLNKELNSFLFDDDKVDEVSTLEKAKKEVDKDPEEDEEDDTFINLSKGLFKHNIFTTDEDEDPEKVSNEIKTPEQFLERMQKEDNKRLNNVLNNYLSKFGDEYYQMFDSVFNKGVNPLDYLNSFSKIENYKNIDLSEETNQERVFLDYWRSQKRFSEDLIQKKLERAKAVGTLEEDAKELHEGLIKIQEEKILDLEREKQKELEQKAQIENYYTQNVSTILEKGIREGDIDGIPVNKEEARLTYDYMTQKQWKLPSGELITDMYKDFILLDNPENHALKVKVALLLKNKMDLSKVVKKATSKQSTGLFSDLTNKSKIKQRENSKSTSFF